MSSSAITVCIRENSILATVSLIGILSVVNRKSLGMKVPQQENQIYTHRDQLIERDND